MKGSFGWLLIPAVCLFSGLLILSTLPASAQDFPKVSCQELKKMIESKAGNFVVVDNQPKSAYDLGHIPGAVNLPWDGDVKRPGSLPKDKTLIFYCACGHEEDALDMAGQLSEKFGYKNIKVLEGGWIEWTKLGYPVEK